MLRLNAAPRCKTEPMQIGIVGHISRNDQVYNLSERVSADVIKMDDSEFFSIHESTRLCAENHIRVLTHLYSLSTRGEACVVLEDDAIPCPAFRTEVAAAVAAAPSQLVGLYLGTGNPSGEVQRNIREALEEADAWLTADFFISAVGYAVPHEMIPPMLESCKTMDAEWPLRITRWSQQIGLLTSYTVPSLCDHADIVSTINPAPEVERRKMARRAHKFGTRSNWNAGAVRLKPAAGWSP